jgi:hypothetical protein
MEKNTPVSSKSMLVVDLLLVLGQASGTFQIIQPFRSLVPKKKQPKMATHKDWFHHNSRQAARAMLCKPSC